MEQENEIENEYALERQRFLEEERIRRARAEADGRAMQAEYFAQKKQSSGGISRVTFFMMLTVAIICDILLALVAIVPYVGWVINGLLSPCVFLMFFIWYKIKGIKYTSMRKMAVLPAGFIIEMIPYVNILPGWTVSVILNTQGDKINKIATPISALKNPQIGNETQPVTPQINLEIQARQTAKQKNKQIEKKQGYYEAGNLSFSKKETVQKETPLVPQNTPSIIENVKQSSIRNISNRENYHFAERKERELGRREERRKAA